MEKHRVALTPEAQLALEFLLAHVNANEGIAGKPLTEAELVQFALTQIARSISGVQNRARVTLGSSKFTIKWNGEQVAQEAALELVADSDRITKSPGVFGGDACIRGTRIPVWVLVMHRDDGMSDEDLLRNFPWVSKEDLNFAWQYFESNKESILAERERHTDEVA